MDTAIRFIEATAKLIAAFAWPVAIIVGVGLVVGKQRDAVRRMFDRITKVSYPGGEAQLAAEAHQQDSTVEKIEELLQKHLAKSGTSEADGEPAPPDDTPIPGSEPRALVERLTTEAWELGRLDQRLAERQPSTLGDIHLALLLLETDIANSPANRRYIARVAAFLLGNHSWRRRLWVALRARSSQLETRFRIAAESGPPWDFERLIKSDADYEALRDALGVLKRRTWPPGVPVP